MCMISGKSHLWKTWVNETHYLIRAIFTSPDYENFHVDWKTTERPDSPEHAQLVQWGTKTVIAIRCWHSRYLVRRTYTKHSENKLILAFGPVFMMISDQILDILHLIANQNRMGLLVLDLLYVVDPILGSRKSHWQKFRSKTHSYLTSTQGWDHWD